MRRSARLLVGMAGASATGDGIVRTVLPLAAAAAPNGAAFVGAVQASARLPWLLVSLPAGRAVDRVGPRPVLTGGLALKFAGLVVLAIAMAGSWWWLLPVAAIIAVSGEVAFETATQVVVVLDHAPPSRPRTNSALQAAQVSLGQFVGPTIAGICWSLSSAAAASAAGAAQLTAAGSRRAWRRSAPAAGEADVGDPAPASWTTGIRALWASPGLRSTTTIGTVGMFAYGLWSACFVLYVTSPTGLEGGSVLFGILVGCPAVGVLLGSQVFPRVLATVTALGGLSAMVVGQFGLFVPAAVGGSAPLVGAGLILYGVGMSGWSTGVLTFRQAAIPPPIYGQVTGAYRFVSWGASPLGALLGGVVAARGGVSTAMAVGTVLVLIQVPMLAWARSLRHHDGS